VNFKTLSSEAVYKGRVFDVYREELAYPDGRSFQMDIIQHNGAVVVVPLDQQGRIIFVRQYRHAVGQHLIELPAGTLELGEDPLVCALRELREETGMAAEEFVPLGEILPAPGYSNEIMHLYFARQLTPSPLPQDEDEILEPLKIPVQQAFEMIASGKIPDAKTQVALFLAKPYLIH
jgi:ADP-ribose pyrophosphatase